MKLDRSDRGAPKSSAWSVLVGLLFALSLTQPAFAGSDQSASLPAPPAGATQVREGGQVTIKVTWSGPSAGPVFSVVMDTHSVNLDTFDLSQLAVLRTNQGLEVQPIAWEAPSGSHHREGTLRFAPTLPDGTALIGPDTSLLELVIRDVAGVPERLLQWTL